MTGFGKAECQLPDKTVSIEIKSLNSKSLNISTKIPDLYSEKEFEIRKIVGEKLQRGKINISFQILNEDEKPASLNVKLINSYYRQLKEITENSGHDPKQELLFQTIMRLPDALKTEDAMLSDSEWSQLEETLNEAIVQTDRFRIQEGESIAADLKEKVRAIENALSDIEKYEEERIQTVKERLEKKLNEIQLPENVSERFEQELIYYLDKFDINEEKQRLANHCRYFFETLEKDAAGKKLAFISQEMGREINTTGSKANHHEIQKIVVDMKDNLEQIKEQLLNTL